MTDKLRLDDDLFRELLEAVEDYVVVVDEEFRIRYVNFTGDGYRLEEVLGTDATRFVHSEHRAPHRSRLERVWAHGVPEEFSVPGRGEPGEREWYAGRVSPIDRGEKRVGLLVLMRNVTELRLAHRQADDLKRLLPVCPWCTRKIRVGEGKWVEIEEYIYTRAEIPVTHGICPDCGEKMMRP